MATSNIYLKFQEQPQLRHKIRHFFQEEDYTLAKPEERAMKRLRLLPNTTETRLTSDNANETPEGVTEKFMFEYFEE